MGGDAHCGSFVVGTEPTYWLADGKCKLGAASEFQWPLRWPRMLTALFAGVGLAIAGTLLQRLIYNPLASPDILGVSSGLRLLWCLLACF